MCGIAGILTTETPDDLVPRLERMRDALRHRGPDDQGIETLTFAHGTLGLAHTRLAILDLSAAGHQPMSDPRTSSWICYNGEVYNHLDIRRSLPDVAFHTGSDTETILQAWIAHGPDCLESLRGMYAFGLYDAVRKQFWLVRDRVGVKPLYVCQPHAGAWVFASEVRAILASGLAERRLNPQALDGYLAFGAVPAPWTLIDGIRSLLPGEAWSFDLRDGVQPQEPVRRIYWQPPFGETTSRSAIPATRAEAVEQLRPVLRQAIDLRMLSDVPVGVFLSGGIDSSAIVASLAGQGHRLRTFSVIFGERDFDESQHSRLVARQFGTEHTELLLRPEEVLRNFDEALSAYDQPSIDGVNTYFVARITRQAGVKVALSGLGGDEIFAGYRDFRTMWRWDKPWIRGAARLAHGMNRLLGLRGMRWQKLAALLQGEGGRLDNYAVCRQVMLPALRQRLLRRSTPPALVGLPEERRADLAQRTAKLDAVNAHSLLELALYLADMLLRDADQMSMAHALELREPLLDHRLIETVAGYPGAWKLAAGAYSPTKGLLVDALDVRLPAEICNRPKKGFVFPWSQWLRTELRDYASAILNCRATQSALNVNGEAVTSLWNDFLAGRPGIRYSDILSLLHLFTWVKREC